MRTCTGPTPRLDRPATSQLCRHLAGGLGSHHCGGQTRRLAPVSCGCVRCKHEYPALVPDRYPGQEAAGRADLTPRWGDCAHRPGQLGQTCLVQPIPAGYPASIQQGLLPTHRLRLGSLFLIVTESARRCGIYARRVSASHPMGVSSHMLVSYCSHMSSSSVRV